MDIREAHEHNERLRGEFRRSLAETGAALSRALDAYGMAERRHIADPDQPELVEQAKRARRELAAAQEAFEKERAAARGRWTRALNEALKPSE